MKRVYLSGRMSGLSPDTWRWRFATYEHLCEWCDYEAVNPAETFAGRHLWAYRLLGWIFGWKTAYRWTLAYDLWLLKKCDYILMVGHDWQQSRGARLERMKAHVWGIEELSFNKK